VTRRNSKRQAGAPGPALLPVPFTPGAAPTLAGFFLRFDAAPEDVLALIDDGLRQPPPVVDLRRRARVVRAVLTVLLLAVSAVAFAVDSRLELPRAVFGPLSAFGWLGIVLVFIATRQPLQISDKATSALGCLTFAALFPAAFLIFAMASGHRVGITAPGWLAASVFFLLLAWSRDFQGDASAPAQASELQPVHEIRAVIDALKHVLAPGRTLGGWIDLSGPGQKSKLCRQGRSMSARGATLSLYHDEWWRLQAPLADGNDLRISAIERRKVRGEYWKKGRRRKKRKPAKESGLAHLELRVQVDPRRVRLVPATRSVRVGELTLLPAQAKDGKVLTAQCEMPLFSPHALTARDVLGVVASFYRQLERVSA